MVSEALLPLPYCRVEGHFGTLIVNLSILAEVRQYDDVHDLAA